MCSSLENGTKEQLVDFVVVFCVFIKNWRLSILMHDEGIIIARPN